MNHDLLLASGREGPSHYQEHLIGQKPFGIFFFLCVISENKIKIDDLKAKNGV